MKTKLQENKTTNEDKTTSEDKTTNEDKFHLVTTTNGRQNQK